MYRGVNWLVFIYLFKYIWKGVFYLGKKDKLKIEFIGMNADNVTGSLTLVQDNDLSILLEAGLFQSNDIVGDYKVNNRNLNFNVKKLDFILLGHVHADHSMLIPRLYAEGCKARIIVPKGTKGFYKLMGVDSAYIVDRDCAALERKYKKSFHRMYTESDVFESLKYMEEYDMGEKITLSDRLTIRFTPSGHIINAAQIELWVSNEVKNKTSKILYTSDLGNIRIPKHYSSTFEPVEKANIVIGECTYNDKKREVKPETREKDLIKIREVIKNNEGIVEIPIFTLDRCQNILTILYDLFGSDPNFNTDVVVDSPLAVKMLKEYGEVLEDEEANKLYEVLSWKNLKLISESAESKHYMQVANKAIVLSAAGMLSKGRSRLWLKRIIEDSRNTILFVGYASQNTLASAIKKARDVNSTIKIDNKEYKNRCKIIDLKSFTSHMQYEDLINYYSSISTDKICLVHSEQNGKLEFAKELQNAIEKRGSRARVVCVNRYTSINL